MKTNVGTLLGGLPQQSQGGGVIVQPLQTKNKNLVRGVLTPRHVLWEEARHPLSQKKVSEFENWQEWLGEWKKATKKSTLLGLLHKAWGAAREVDREECILFLLSLAHGHAKDYMYFVVECGDKPFQVNVRSSFENAQSVIRLDIARKAFAVLCAEFFRIKSKEMVWVNGWYGVMTNYKVVDSLINFLRLEGGFAKGHYRLFNLPVTDSPNKEAFLVFAKSFCLTFSNFRCGHQGSQFDDLAEILRDRQHRLLPTMLHLGILEQITDPRFRAGENPLLMRYLRQVVRYYQKQGRYVSVEETAANGSVPARVYMVLENNRKLYHQ